VMRDVEDIASLNIVKQDFAHFRKNSSPGSALACKPISDHHYRAIKT
jgi:hypothetical protein